MFALMKKAEEAYTARKLGEKTSEEPVHQLSGTKWVGLEAELSPAEHSDKTTAPLWLQSMRNPKTQGFTKLCLDSGPTKSWNNKRVLF